MNKNLWTSNRVPHVVTCENCKSWNSSSYDFTVELTKHRYVCEKCKSVKLYSVDEINERYFQALRWKNTA